MDAATQLWLDDLIKAGSLSDEDKTALLKVANNPKADEFIKGSALRQSDYSRKMQEVQSLQTQIQQKEADVTKFQTDLANWKAGAEGNYQKAVQEREGLERQLSAATSKLRTVATLHGVPEDEWKVDATIIEKPKAPEPKYLTQEEAEAQTRKLLTESALIDAAMHDLNVRHIELFGTPLKGGVAFVQEAMKSGKPLTAFFDEKFKVSEREAVIAEEAVQKRVNDAVAANEAKLRSEMNIATPRANDPRSPLFAEGFKPKLDTNGQRVDAVSAATLAYNAGKYQAKIPGQV